MHPIFILTISLIGLLIIKIVIKELIVSYRRKQIKLIKSDKSKNHIEECWNEINN